jgi:cytidine deaminase
MSEQQPPSSGGIDWGSLREAALEAMEKAYVPYSKFPVGVAAIVTDGRIIAGCNVENASYGLTVCAERNAIAAAVAAGAKRIRAAAVTTADGGTPCGACRQVLAELGAAAMPILVARPSGAPRATTLGALLPDAFAL